MAEFEASTVPTEGREATSGRGAQGYAAQPAVRNDPPRAGPVLDVTISRPSAVTGRAPPPPELPRLTAIAPLVPPLTPQSTTRGMPDLPPIVAQPALRATAAIERPGAEAKPSPRPVRLDWLPRIWSWMRRAVIYGAIAFAAWFIAVIVSIAVFRYVDPPFSNLMLLQRMSGEVLVQKWLPIDRMPAQIIRAIIVSEDGRFCVHGGIDLKAIEIAIETSKDGTPRGASTITMQVAKNLYLWPSKSYVRKALEVPITLAIEAMWSKRRIFEVYANIAEWGPGVFGVEAAAGYHFGKSAGRVSEREAALLAVALPNPVTRDAGDPGPGTERLANTIQSRMRAQSRAASCIERPRR